MAKIFSGIWMQAFASLWNKDKEMLEKLSEVNFTSIVVFNDDAFF